MAIDPEKDWRVRTFVFLFDRWPFKGWITKGVEKYIEYDERQIEKGTKKRRDKWIADGRPQLGEGPTARLRKLRDKDRLSATKRNDAHGDESS